MHKQFLPYIDGKSFLHQLDPRTKIVTLMILSLVIFNVHRIWSLFSLLVLFFFVAFIARLSLKKLLFSIKPMFFFILIVFLLHFLFAPVPVFSDVSLSVDMMDHQLKNRNQNVIIFDDEHTDFYVLRYYSAAPAPDTITFYDLSCHRKMPAESEFYIGLYAFTLEKPREPNYPRFKKLSIEELSEENFQDFSIKSDDFGTKIFEDGSPLKNPLVYKISFFKNQYIFINLSVFSFITGIGVALKFILLILFASLLTATTKQSALVQGIEKMIRPLPLRRINMTSHDLAFMVLLTIRFIPLLISVASQLQFSLKARAFNSLKNPFQTVQILSTGLVQSVIRSADNASKAMQNRGYTGIGKTSMNELKFKRKDGIFFVSFFLTLSLIILSVGWIQLSLAASF